MVVFRYALIIILIVHLSRATLLMQGDKMKTKYLYFLVLPLILSFSRNISGQNSLNQKSIFPAGITIEYGIGNYAVTDDYISTEKYSGSLPYYRLLWTKPHDDYVYHLGIDYRYSSDIKNNNVSTDIYQFTLNQGFNYAIPEFTLFNNNAYLYLGPSTELFFYYNNQNIAVSGFDYAQSIASLISLGISSELFYPLSDKFCIETSLDFDLLSLGFRTVDTEETDESPAKLLTVIAATNTVFRLGLRYYLIENLSIKASYLFNLTRISAWEPLLSASDNVVFTLTYGF